MRIEAERAAAALLVMVAIGAWLLAGLGSRASAQESEEPLPEVGGRLGRVLSLQTEAPGIWIGRRALWVPEVPEPALSICPLEGACAPVVERAECAAPECPGSGWILRSEHDMAEVEGFPQGYEAFQREQQAMRNDPRFAALVGHLQPHPEQSDRARERSAGERDQERERRRHAEDPRWVSDYRDGDRWEISAHLGFGGMPEVEGLLYGTAMVAIGPHLLLEEELANEEDDPNPFTFLGDELGLEARARFLGRLASPSEGAGPEWAVAVGAAATIRNRLAETPVRMFSMLSVWIPEVGAFLRPDRDPSLYVAWEAPVEILLDHDTAFSIRLNLMWIEDYRDPPFVPAQPEDLVGVDSDGDTDALTREELMVSLSLGIIWP